MQLDTIRKRLACLRQRANQLSLADAVPFQNMAQAVSPDIHTIGASIQKPDPPVFLPLAVASELRLYKETIEDPQEPFKILQLLHHFQNDAPQDVMDWTDEGYQHEINLVKAYLDGFYTFHRTA